MDESPAYRTAGRPCHNKHAAPYNCKLSAPGSTRFGDIIPLGYISIYSGY